MYLEGGSLSTERRTPAGAEKQKAENSSPQSLASSTQAEVEQRAEECFLKAIEVSQKQQAKSLELRTVRSLVRLRQRQAQGHAPRTTHHETRNRLVETHKTLSNIYNCFTEGFDTKDLQEAKALIDELKH